ncbi:hypothetical protein C8R45DRAFT_1216425 [Mycena sanguinolenta]|nr:hypothetical protein C8R45DRAFT_1216425 [Mycena sanguinolenta]
MQVANGCSLMDAASVSQAPLEDSCRFFLPLSRCLERVDVISSSLPPELRLHSKRCKNTRRSFRPYEERGMRIKRMLLRLPIGQLAAHGYALGPECGYDTAVLGTADFLSTSRPSSVLEILSGSFHQHDQCIPYPPSLDLGRGCSRGATGHRLSLLYAHRLGPVFAPPFNARLLCHRTNATRLHSAPTHDALDFGTPAPLRAFCHSAAQADATYESDVRTYIYSIHLTALHLRGRLQSTSHQPTSCVLDLPRPRSSAASIPRSSVAAEALRGGEEASDLPRYDQRLGIGPGRGWAVDVDDDAFRSSRYDDDNPALIATFAVQHLLSCWIPAFSIRCTASPSRSTRAEFASCFDVVTACALRTPSRALPCAGAFPLFSLLLAFSVPASTPACVIRAFASRRIGSSPLAQSRVVGLFLLAHPRTATNRRVARARRVEAPGSRSPTFLSRHHHPPSSLRRCDDMLRFTGRTYLRRDSLSSASSLVQPGGGYGLRISALPSFLLPPVILVCSPRCDSFPFLVLLADHLVISSLSFSCRPTPSRNRGCCTPSSPPTTRPHCQHGDLFRFVEFGKSQDLLVRGGPSARRSRRTSSCNGAVDNSHLFPARPRRSSPPYLSAMPAACVPVSPLPRGRKRAVVSECHRVDDGERRMKKEIAQHSMKTDTQRGEEE